MAAQSGAIICQLSACDEDLRGGMSWCFTSNSLEQGTSRETFQRVTTASPLEIYLEQLLINMFRMAKERAGGICKLHDRFHQATKEALI